MHAISVLTVLSDESGLDVVTDSICDPYSLVYFLVSVVL